MATVKTKVTTPHERLNRLKEKVLVPPRICFERGYLTTKSYQETEGQPYVIRRAKALRKNLEEMTINIEPEELIVGRATKYMRGGPIMPEISSSWWIKEMDQLSTRDWNSFDLDDEDKRMIKEFLPYWKGQSLQDKFKATVPEDILKLNGKVVTGVSYANNNQWFGHASVDFDRILNKGIKDIKKQVQSELMKLDMTVLADFEKYLFLKAADITLDAAVAFAHRWADLAEDMSRTESNPQRKAELKQTAEILRWVPENPARSFYEALQSIWMVHVTLTVESNLLAFGRADQYLYPFYRKDIDEGKITREQAREMISLYLVKLNGYDTPQSMETQKAFASRGGGGHHTLGGLTPDGKDATNELSYLYLDATSDVGLMEEFIVRIHPNTPEPFLMRSCEVAKKLVGKLKFVGDATIIPQLLGDGKPLEYARDYIITGCNSPCVPARSLDLPGGMFNLALFLELALNNGVSRLTGEQLGPKTGDPRKFTSYDEVWNAYKQQVEALIPAGLLMKAIDKTLYAQYCPTPFQSALTIGPIEKGKDITNGGTAPLISFANCLAGGPNVGDSLAAIKKCVFEDKKLTMSRLIDALDKNFEGEEAVLHILKSVPKYGNDIDYVDNIVNDAMMFARDQVVKAKGFAGAVSNASAGISSANVPLGAVVGALPDGRVAGLPVAEGGVSPYQGRNVSGPTSTMRSALKLDLTKLTNGSVLNMRFSPDALKDEAKLRKFSSLIRTYLTSGGFLVQFNIISADTLREAQRHPEKYRDLLVRVSTYSAYFVELSPELQNDIINRTEFQEV